MLQGKVRLHIIQDINFDVALKALQYASLTILWKQTVMGPVSLHLLALPHKLVSTSLSPIFKY